MITLQEFWTIAIALATVFVIFGITRVSSNWLKYPVLAILVNTEPFVLYIRLLGITICKIGKPDYFNNWNTFSFIIHGNALIAYKWFIYGHQKSSMIFVKNEINNWLSKTTFGKKYITYARAPGVTAFDLHIEEFSKQSNYFVMGTRTVKQRFKRTIVEYGFILIGECELYDGKCFIEASNQEQLRVKMTEIYRTMYALSKAASDLSSMVAMADANMRKQANGDGTMNM